MLVKLEFEGGSFSGEKETRVHEEINKKRILTLYNYLSVKCIQHCCGN